LTSKIDIKTIEDLSINTFLGYAVTICDRIPSDLPYVVTNCDHIQLEKKL